MAEVTRARSARGSGESLRAEIVAAARALMAASPSAESVSIRAVAAAVGVTAPSIYRHFADKEELITAVVTDVFDELDRVMVAAASGVSPAIERLKAYGMAYVGFALDHPEAYRLATMDACPRPDVDSVLAQSAWVHFRSTVEDCLADGTFAPADPDQITIDLWSAAHGIAAIMIAKPFLPYGSDRMETVDRVLRAAAYGHTVAPGSWP